ncbi:MAG: threonylcarbamoyl-AMP synthase [Treponema sp.]|nr:L-threonylcarbamoyladenylate synthase [Treponema sp.]MCR5612304.1 threonylcarbamoyl-AMP synthase [Treponema sp.]
MKCLKSDKNSAELCASILLKGGIVIIPTDTVYGFSGIVDEKSETDSKIRKIKGREETKPFIQLIGSPSDIHKYTDDVIPDSLLAHWPGPLTIIVNNKLSKTTTAFRCPDESWLCDVLNKVNAPIYSSSANRSGSPLLDFIEKICAEFNDEVDLIVDDGDRIGGVASTIVSVADGDVKVIRQGAVKI